MPSGLQIINNGNILQIDSDFKNNRLLIKTTVFTGPVDLSGYNMNFSYTTASAGKPNTIIAFRSAYKTFISSTNVNGVMVHTIYCEGPNRAVDIWIFDDSAPSSSTFGLQVFTAGGQLAYDSQAQYMKPVGFVTRQSPNTQTPTNTTGIENFSTLGYHPAVVFCSLSSHQQMSVSQGPNGGQLYAMSNWYCAVSTFNGGCQAQDIISSIQSAPSPFNPVSLNSWYAMMFLDVDSP